MGCLSPVFTVALMFGFFQNGHGIKPKMSPDQGILSIYMHDALRIECYSKVARVKFSLPEFRSFQPRSKHQIYEDGNGTYTLLLKSAEKSDAGWYACAEEGVIIDNDFRKVNHMDEDVSWIYVYVPDGAGDIDFVDSGLTSFPKTIILVPGSAVVIPCRPTNQTRDIQLWQNFKLVDLEREAVRFDPKIGFIMKRVAFADEAIFQCKSKYAEDQYILRDSDWRPTMIISSGEYLILQEGDLLRIECFSESKLSFLYPTISTNSSAYEIVENENGTSTFLRRSVISDDTGWYGCAGMDIENHDIPEYSIDYTKKEISWVYVYVNSSVKIISPLMDSVSYTSNGGLRDFVIPCRPTSPELHIQLEQLNGEIWSPTKYISQFDPKVGFIHHPSEKYKQSVYRCATTEPVRYVSKNYSLADVNVTMHSPLKLAIWNVDDPTNSDHLIIRMTGDDLRMRCETVASAAVFYLTEWTVPNRVSASRIIYNRTRSDGRDDLDVFYLRRRMLTMTVSNLSETDSGQYICSVTSDQFTETDSRTVEVFDKAGKRYLRLRETLSSIVITGRKGETIKWLLDLTEYPSAELTRVDYDIESSVGIENPFEIETASRGEAPLFLVKIKNLTTTLRGTHKIFFKSLNQTLIVRNYIDVQEPPTVRLNSTKGFHQTSGATRIDASCWSFGLPEPDIEITFRECPKYPSRAGNCNQKCGLEWHAVYRENGWKIYRQQFHISLSGILACEVCNPVACSVVTEHILYSASDKPYFTSTNLDKTEVISDTVIRKGSGPIILECFAAGDPYPNVTWFKDGFEINDSRQRKFAYDNRELTVIYFSDDDNGRYTCRAENIHGLVEDYIDINLQEALRNLNSQVDQRVSDETNASSSIMVAAIVTLLVIVVICCIIIYRQYTKSLTKKLADLAFEKGAVGRFNPELSVVDQAELLPYDLKWEYPRGLLKFDKTIGSGAFGIVKKAEARSICRGEAVTTVAVKLVRSTASLNFITALTRELKILAYLGKHPNVVNLLGACTTNVFYGELYVIVEYCRFGNLRDHLLNGRGDFVDQGQLTSTDMGCSSFSSDGSHLPVNHAPFSNFCGLDSEVNRGDGSFATVHHCQRTDITGASEESEEDCDDDQDSGEAQRLRSKYKGDCTNPDLEPICTRDLVYWSWQVSRGMEFLGERRIVHGDLAARNILLADNGIVKVCDFGLAKALYKEAEYRDTGSNPLPVKWMAIESIADQVFSVQSDVWSFGIVMWEIFSLGETPYPGMRQRGLVQKLIDGYRMEPPKYAAETMYDMMRHCWDADPAKRPSFNDLSHNFCELLDDGFKTQYLEMHAQYLEMNAEALNDGEKDYLTMSPSAIAAGSSSEVDEQIQLRNLPQDVSETPV